MFMKKLFKRWKRTPLGKVSAKSNHDSFTGDNHHDSGISSLLKHDGMGSSCCFMSISMTVEKYDHEELIELANDIFNTVHEKHPNVELELTDHKNDRYLIGGDTFIMIPVVNKEKVDFDCVFKAIQKILEDKGKKKLKKKYLSYTFKIIQEGHLGEGYELMTKEDWLTKVRTLDYVEDFPAFFSNFYTYKPTGKLPSWKITGPIKGNNVKIMKDAYEYAQELISKYWELKKQKIAL